MSELSLSALTSRPDKLAAKHGNMYLSACRKSLFSPLNKFSELHKSSENLGFQWRRETGEAPPVADQARAVSRKAPKQRIRRIRCLACGDGVSLLGLSPRQEPPYGGCAPKHACGRRPAHTLPYRRGEFTTLSTVSGQSQSGLPFHFGFFRNANLSTASHRRGCGDRPSANATFLRRFRDAQRRSTYHRSRCPSSLSEADW